MLRLMKKNEGSTLILVLMVAVVFVILSIAIGTFAISENRQAMRQQKKTQAYYIARAGAEATITCIMNMDSDDLKKFNELTYPIESVEESFGEGLFQVEISKDENQDLIIKSTGKIIDGKNEAGEFNYIEEITIIVLDKEASDVHISEFDVAAFAEDCLIVSGSGKINGNIAINATEKNSIDIKNNNKNYGEIGTVYVPQYAPDYIFKNKINSLNIEFYDEVRTYLPPVLPEFPDSLEKRFNIEHNNINIETIITGNGEYEKFTINKGTVIVDTTKADIILRVKELHIKGHLKIKGSNKLILYVDDVFDFANKSTLNLGGETENVNIYFKGQEDNNENKELILSGNKETIINASLYLGNIDLKFTGNRYILGDIITGGSNVSITGNSNKNNGLLYAPNALVTIKGEFYGSIIGESVSVEGNGYVKLVEGTIVNNRIPIHYDDVNDGPVIYSKGYWE